MKITYKFT